jgi:hypothetical protein
MNARPGLCGGHRATGVPTAIANYHTPVQSCPQKVRCGDAKGHT